MPVDRRAARLAELLKAAAITALIAGASGPIVAQTGADAQDAAAEPAQAEDVAADLAAEEEPLYTYDDLKDLAAPIALYPDTLLAQILIAATVPLDVVMADRWLKDNPDVKPADIEEAVADETWDPSVKALMAFPTVLDAMGNDPEWTQDLGDAFVVQQGDLLDAVQDLRAEAQAAGNLASNEAQNVVVDEDDAIVIEPAQPEVVYVPTYDPNVVYQPTAAAAPVQPTTTVVQEDDSSDVVGTAIVSGLVGFGTGILVSEIFDDDDDYWCCGHHGYRGIGWYDRNVYAPPPRGGRYQRGDNIVVNGDVNVNRRPWHPDDRDRLKRERKLEDMRRDTGAVRRSQPRTASYAKHVETRHELQRRVGGKPALQGAAAAHGASRSVSGARNARDVERQLQTRGSSGAARKISKPESRATPARKPSASSAFSAPGGGSRSQAINDRKRGTESLQKSRGSTPTRSSAASARPSKPTLQRPTAAKPQAKTVAKPRPTPAKTISKPPTRKAPTKSSAFSGARKGGASSVQRASSRGSKSKGRIGKKR